jgi:hypothetical protein
MPSMTELVFAIPRSPRQALDDARATIAAVRPDLKPEMGTHHAALVLLVGGSVHFNVDRIARIAGLDRTFVAKAVRRLFDNGVWVNGETVGEWNERELGPSFWRDVSVAEGHLYRRFSEDGELEWGFPGSWWKAYDFGDTSQGANPAVRYSYAVEEDEREVSRPLATDAADDAADEEEPELAIVGIWEDESPWSLSRSRSYGLGNTTANARAEARSPIGAGVAGAPELFPDAVWLG